MVWKLPSLKLWNLIAVGSSSPLKTGIKAGKVSLSWNQEVLEVLEEVLPRQRLIVN